MADTTAPNASPAYAPVVLFVYNRPKHTKQTIEALQRNSIAKDCDLFIFSDAAKDAAALDAVTRVRDYVKSVSGFRSVTVVAQDVNQGLARSIIDGVTSVIEKFGKVIVVEDDIITAPYFLKFMNDALDLYADTPEVMHISGCTYPIETDREDASYFLHLPLCWGWATWQRAWVNFKKDISVMDRFDRPMISRFNFDDTYPNYWEQLELNRQGRIDTWFVFWYATVFLDKGLVLFPKQSLVRNIGMDGSGVHLGKTLDYDGDVCQDPIALSRIPLQVSEKAYARHKRYFRSVVNPTFASRVLRKLRRIIVGNF